MNSELKQFPFDFKLNKKFHLTLKMTLLQQSSMAFFCFLYSGKKTIWSPEFIVVDTLNSWHHFRSDLISSFSSKELTLFLELQKLEREFVYLCNGERERVCVCVLVYLCVRECMCLKECVFVCACVWVRKCVFVYLCKKYTCLCVKECIFVCMRVCAI